MDNNKHDNRYEQLYNEMVSHAAGLHKRNKKRIKISIIIMILLPLVLFGIRWLTDSDKMTFLVIWIIGLFIIAAYMIGVSYLDNKVDKAIRVQGEGSFDGLMADPGIAEIKARAKEKYEFLSEGKPKIRSRGSILNIIVRDFRGLTKSVVGIVILIGLCVIPALFVWFNILSNWDPFEFASTSRVPIAVAVEDKGVDMLGIRANVGDKFKEAIEANSMINWVICDSGKQAKEGVRAGDYYAALVVPEDFTEDILSFSSGKLRRPQIVYYMNEKKNAVAPRITDVVSETMKKEANKAFIETLGKYASEALTVAGNAGLNPGKVFSDLGDTMRKLSSDLEISVALLKSADGLTDAADDLLTASDKLLGNTKDTLKHGEKLLRSAEKKVPGSENKTPVADAVTKEADLLKKDLDILSGDLKTARTDMESYNEYIDKKLDLRKEILSDIKSSVDNMQAKLKKLGLKVLSKKFSRTSSRLGSISAKIDKLEKAGDSNWDSVRTQIDGILADMSQAKEDISNISSDLDGVDGKVANAMTDAKKSISEIRSSLSGVYGNMGTLTRGLEKTENALGSLENGLGGTVNVLSSLQNGCLAIGGMFDAIAESGTLEDLNDLLKDNTEVIAENLAEPVKIEKKDVYPIKHFGSVMSPFYSVVGLWIGALLAAVLISREVERRRRKEDYLLYQKFFGRFRLFMMIGVLQALLMMLGELLYVDIWCAHPWLLILAALVISFTFMAIVYSLYFVFENLGLALCVVIMLLQVAGGGGIYPVETMPGIFGKLYPVMPFHYAMDALRECVGGKYGNTYWKCLGALLIFAAVFFVLGLLLYKPVSKPLELMEKNKKDSEIML